MTDGISVDGPGVSLARCAFFYKGELAEYLGLSTRTVDRLDAAGKLPEACRIGGKKAWLRSEVAEWVAAHCPARHSDSSRKKSR
jgi:excisionase family DNA binding protein